MDDLNSIVATALAAYNVLLYRYSGQETIVLGLTSAARDRPQGGSRDRRVELADRKHMVLVTDRLLEGGAAASRGAC